MVYAFVQITVTNPDSFTAYAKEAGPLLAKWGAKPEAMSTEPMRLEGDTSAPSRAVLLSFPDKAAAVGWIEDPDAQEVHALRRASGPCEITLIA